MSHLKPEKRGKQDHHFSGNSDILKLLLRQTGNRIKHHIHIFRPKIILEVLRFNKVGTCPPDTLKCHIII